MNLKRCATQPRTKGYMMPHIAPRQSELPANVIPSFRIRCTACVVVRVKKKTAKGRPRSRSNQWRRSLILMRESVKHGAKFASSAGDALASMRPSRRVPPERHGAANPIWHHWCSRRFLLAVMPRRDSITRAKTSLYAWIPDLTLLFFLQLCESAVDNLRSPPDVFIVPVSLRKWIFSQISYSVFRILRFLEF